MGVLQFFKRKKTDKIKTKVKARPDGGLTAKVRAQWGATTVLLVFAAIASFVGLDLDVVMPDWRDTLRPLANFVVFMHENGEGLYLAIAALGSLLTTLVGQFKSSAEDDIPVEATTGRVPRRVRVPGRERE